VLNYDWATLKKNLPRIESENIHSKYVVCSSPCGGGELLGRLLRKTGRAGLPHYFFHRNSFTQELLNGWGLIDDKNDVNYVKYLLKLEEYKTSKDGCFGLLVYPRQLKEHLRLLTPYKKIVVLRKNWAEQTVDALEGSEQLRTSKKKVEFLYGNLVQCLYSVIEEEMILRQFFQNKNDVLKVYFEDLCDDPIKVIKRVEEYLGMDFSFNGSTKEKNKFYAMIPKANPDKTIVIERFQKMLSGKNILRK
jgi:LPS sulfotransferase NodH